MIKITPRQYAIIAIGALIVLSAAIVAFVIIPAATEITALNRDIAQTEKYLESQLARTRRIRRSLQRITEIQRLAAAYAEARIERGKELPIITELEGIAARNGVDQTLHVEFHDTVDGEAPHETFLFDNRATFANHLRYMRELEMLPAYIFIDRMELQRSDKGASDDPKITLHFEGKIYTR